MIIMSKKNTDMTASTKAEYPEVAKVVGNFTTLDYLRFFNTTALFITAGYLSRIKLGRSPMMSWGLCGVMNGFMYTYLYSSTRQATDEVVQKE